MNPKRTQALVTATTNPQSAKPLTLRLVTPLKITRGIALAACMVVASGGTGGYVYALSSGSTLPDGLFGPDAATGAITGTPTTVDHYVFQLEVEDSSSTVVQAWFSMDVVGRIGTDGRGTEVGEIGIAYSNQFKVSHATGTVTWTKIAGTLPAGLSLASNGILSGTPTADGISYYTVHAFDSGTGDSLDIATSTTIVPLMDYAGIAPQLFMTVGEMVDYDASHNLIGGLPPFTFDTHEIDTATSGTTVLSQWLTFHPFTMRMTGIPPASAAMTPDYGGVPTPGIPPTGGGVIFAQEFYIYVKDAAGVVFAWDWFYKVFPGSLSGQLQPQKNTVSIGDPGPVNINLIEGSGITIDVTNDGTTASFEISAAGGADIPTIRRIAALRAY